MLKESLRGFGLSPLQKRLWLMQKEEGHTPYLTRCAILIQGELRIDLLISAISRVINRHEILRTNFRRLPGMFLSLQFIQEDNTPNLRIIDLSDEDGGEQEARLEALSEKVCGLPFDWERDRLLRLFLLIRSRSSHILLVCLPALCADSTSLKNFALELGQSYAASSFSDGFSDEPLQYADLAEWQNELLTAEESKAGIAYWKNQDFSVHDVPRLPFENQFRAEAGFVQGYLAINAKPVVMATVSALADQYQVSESSFFLACWHVLLWRLTGQAKIWIGVAHDCRNYEGLERALGLFARYLPVGQQLETDLPFTMLLKRLNQVLANASKWQEFFYPEEESKTHGGGIPAPFFAYGFDFAEQELRCSIGDLTFSVHNLDSCLDRFDLRLTCAKTEGALKIGFHYDSRMFLREDISRLADQFHTLIENAANRPTAAVGHLNLLSDEDRLQQLFEFDQGNIDRGAVIVVHQLFERRAALSPDKIAVVHGERQLTYGELNARANQVARFLQSFGVGPEVLVGICIERSLEMVIGLLGVLKAGGAYAPLDPSYPDERLAFMIEDARMQALLTLTGLMERLSSSGVQTICLDVQWDKIAKQSVRDLNCPVCESNLAYVIYTSGSTGRPKGSMIHHAGLANYLDWCANAYPAGEDSAVLAHSSLSFDLTVTSLYLPLLAGGKIRLLPEPGGPEAILDACREEGEFTFIKITPAHLELLAQQIQQQDAPALPHALIIGGENLPTHSIKYWQSSAPETTIFNEYGPTETTVGCCVFQVPGEGWSKSGSVPIGRPIFGSQVHVLDHQLQPVPFWITGQLHIGGAGLSRGYLNRPELTAEKFLPNPFSLNGGALLYQSGDLGRLLPSGDIEFQGRFDCQVKLRGYRVELGEIESHLLGIEGVKGAVVTLREVNDGDRQLVAYCVCEGELNLEEIRESLGRKLPAYMVPAIFVELDTLPLTPNGKVNRQCLPSPAESLSFKQRSIYVEPRTQVEKRLAAIWEEVLGIEMIGINDNFLDLGGHSLKAARIISRVHKEMGSKIRLNDLLSALTIKNLSTILQESVPSKYSDITTLPEQEFYPLSHSQRSIWLTAQFDEEETSLNIVNSFLLVGEPNKESLDRALADVINKYESLRTTFNVVDGEPKQKIHRDVQFRVDGLDFSGQSDGDETAKDYVDRKIVEPFNLSEWPLFRVILIKLENKRYLFSLIMHHIINDGWGLAVFARDFLRQYNDYVEGKASPLKPLRVQYKDYATWRNRQLKDVHLMEQHRQYWLTKLDGQLPVLDLKDYVRPAVRTGRGATLDSKFSPAMVRSLKQLSRENQATNYMTYLSIVYALLYKYTGQEDFIIGNPVAGRNHYDLEDQIGHFINLLPLRAEVRGEQTFRELLLKVKHAVIEADEHQLYPFEELVKDLNPWRDGSHATLFDIIVVLHNYDMPVIEGAGIQSISQYINRNPSSKWDLTFGFNESGAEPCYTLRYNPDSFRHSTIEQLARHFANLVEEICLNPDRRLDDLDLLTKEEKHKICIEFNDTATEFPKDKTICRLFEEQVERTPDAVAICHNDDQLTYATLNRYANRLARHVQTKGVVPDLPVGIITDYFPEVVVAILATLKTGGAYVLLDPAYPPERLSRMLDIAGVSILLGRRRLLDELRTCGVDCRSVDLDNELIWQNRNGNLLQCATADNLAYIIYTSGSTGDPKAISIPHRAVVRLVCDTNYISLSPRECVAQASNSSFDAFTFELWGVLLHGARLVSLNKYVMLDPSELARQLRARQIDTIFLTTALFNQVVAAEQGVFARMHQVLFGGEAVDVARVRQSLAGGPARLLHVYGPTESTTFATWYEVHEVKEDAVTVPIGRAISNTEMYVLDGRMEAAPIGVAGELYLGGAGLARGYAGRGDLTADRFVPHPHAKIGGERLYRTGDVGRCGVNGEAEFLGRIDQQVKIRGYRIEPEEVQKVLGGCQGVREAFVVAREDVVGEKRLVAYVVPDPESVLTCDALRALIREKAPEYMVPSAFVFLDFLPLALNGKVDRTALPAPVPAPSSQLEEREIEPRNELERTIAAIWRKVLNLERVGINDNFFDLGGHSISVIAAHNQIKYELKKEFAVIEMFQYPTISSLAEHLSREKGEEPTFQHVLDRAAKQRQSVGRQQQLFGRRGGSDE